MRAKPHETYGIARFGKIAHDCLSPKAVMLMLEAEAGGEIMWAEACETWGAYRRFAQVRHCPRGLDFARDSNPRRDISTARKIRV